VNISIRKIARPRGGLKHIRLDFQLLCKPAFLAPRGEKYHMVWTPKLAEIKPRHIVSSAKNVHEST